jgi:predicted oxidoreductase
MAWSPLGGGKPLAQADQLSPPVASLLEKYDASLSQLLLAWLLRHPAGIVPVLGTARAARLREGAAAQQLQIDREDWFALLQWARGHEVA